MGDGIRVRDGIFEITVDKENIQMDGRMDGWFNAIVADCKVVVWVWREVYVYIRIHLRRQYLQTSSGAAT